MLFKNKIKLKFLLLKVITREVGSILLHFREMKNAKIEDKMLKMDGVFDHCLVGAECSFDQF